MEGHRGVRGEPADIVCARGMPWQDCKVGGRVDVMHVRHPSLHGSSHFEVQRKLQQQRVVLCDRHVVHHDRLATFGLHLKASEQLARLVGDSIVHLWRKQLVAKEHQFACQRTHLWMCRHRMGQAVVISELPNGLQVRQRHRVGLVHLVQRHQALRMVHESGVRATQVAIAAPELLRLLEGSLLFLLQRLPRRLDIPVRICGGATLHVDDVQHAVTLELVIGSVSVLRGGGIRPVADEEAVQRCRQGAMDQHKLADDLLDHRLHVPHERCRGPGRVGLPRGALEAGEGAVRRRRLPRRGVVGRRTRARLWHDMVAQPGDPSGHLALEFGVALQACVRCGRK
mmetsp:Transcript_5031/g.14268  ORF Transcript_5031/g.14268 Transcript_5031/m.14268 type:complete len:341 (+) Transcript_5031:617-1639(+)